MEGGSLASRQESNQVRQPKALQERAAKGLKFANTQVSPTVPTIQGSKHTDQKARV